MDRKPYEGVRFFTFSVTFFDLVRPVAAVGLGVVGQALGACEIVGHTVDTVSEVAAITFVSQPQVHELMRAVVCRLGRFWNVLKGYY